MKSKRLGKGLEALIPQISPEEQEEHRDRGDTLSNIKVSKIKPNPLQPRMEFDRERLEQLKQSISENGIIQPITVRMVNDHYELIAGERRFRAISELGFNTVPAYIISVDSDDRVLEMALIENIQREDLNPIEIAKAYHKLQKDYGLTQEEVSKKVGKDRATVSNFIRLLKLPQIIQESLQHDEISMGHAKALMGVTDENEQIQLWKKIVKNNLNVRKVESMVKELTTKSSHPAEEKIKKSPFILEIENSFRSVLGTQVNIKPSNKGGKIEISYFSDDELDRLAELIQGIE